MLTSTFPRWEGDHEPPFVYELCRRLVTRFDVLVLAPHAPGAKQRETMGGVEVVRFRYFFHRWQNLAYEGGILAKLRQNRWRYLQVPFFFFFQLLALIRILGKRKFDVIHAHWLIPQGLVAIWALFLRKGPRLLCTSHGADLYGLRGVWLDRPKRAIIKRTAALTVVSRVMAELAVRLGAKAESLHVISMGVDAQTLFTPARRGERRDHELLFVGRLVEKKGLTYLLGALPAILARYPRASLSIAGSGPEEERLRFLAEKLGISDRVTFLGPIPNPELPHLYRRAAVFIAPSIVAESGDQEGLGLVLAEAMACECPVVASDLPAIRDVVIDGVTGLTARERNSADLASKVIALLDNPDLRKRLAEEGRRHVLARFDWEVVADRYARLIEVLAQ
ncbi:MAG: glycosyltransferase family 4 protein [Pseudomonadota bacterium]